MPQITVVADDGSESTISYDSPTNLMECLRDAGFDQIAALCGGNCSCATCHVHVDSKSLKTELTPPEPTELELLELADYHDSSASRLSCQIMLDNEHDGMVVKLLPTGW